MYVYKMFVQAPSTMHRGEQISRDLEGFQDYNMITADRHGWNMLEIEI